MATDILASDFLVPGGYVQINLAMGPGTASVGERDVLIIAPKLAAGTWTAGVKYPVTSENDVISGAGAGSWAHTMTREFLVGNRQSRLFVMPVAPTSGGTPVAATATRTVSGTPTASGYVDVFIMGEQIRYVFGTSDTPTTIAAGLAALVNGRTWLPVTATSSVGGLILTCKTAGASGNNSIFVVTQADAGKGITWSAESGYLASGADGTTTETANYATCLNNLLSDSSYYLVLAANDSTTLAALNSHLAACAEPKVGLRKRGIVGYNGTKSSATALATARNYERLHIVAQNNSYYTPGTMAAMYAAVTALLESQDPTNVPIGFSDGAFNIKSSPFVADWFTQTDINDLLTDGVIPIQSKVTGGAIVDGVTTRSKDSTKTYDDTRALYQERVSLCDYIAAEILSLYALTYAGKKLQADTKLDNGAVDLNQDYPPGVVKPQMVRDLFKGRIRFWEKNALIQEGDKAIKALDVSISSVNSQRLNVRLDLKTVSHVRQLAATINEVSG